MAPLQKIAFDVQGERQISVAFQAYAHEVEDMSVPLGRSADVILAHVRENFATEGKAGQPAGWAPLSPAYQAWKAKHYPGRPILVRQGGMKGALLNRALSVTVLKQRMLYHPPNRYAGYHQTGTRHMPARPPVRLTDAAIRQAIDRVFVVWLHEQRQKFDAEAPG